MVFTRFGRPLYNIDECNWSSKMHVKNYVWHSNSKNTVVVNTLCTSYDWSKYLSKYTWNTIHVIIHLFKIFFLWATCIFFVCKTHALLTTIYWGRMYNNNMHGCKILDRYAIWSICICFSFFKQIFSCWKHFTFTVGPRIGWIQIGWFFSLVQDFLILYCNY